MKNHPRATRLITLGALVALLMPTVTSAWIYTPGSTEDVVGQPHFSTDGKYAVVLSDVKSKTYDQVLFFNTGSNVPAWTFSPTAKVFNVGISGNGKYVAVVGSKIWLLKSDSNKPVWSKKVTTGAVDAVTLNTTGSLMAVGDRSSTVSLYKDLKSKVAKSWTLGDREDGIQSLAFSSDGKYLLASTHLSVQLINLAKAKPVWRYATKSHAEQIAFSRDGKVAVVSDRNTVYDLNASTGKLNWSKSLKGMYAPEVRVSDNGSVVVAGTDKIINAYNSAGTELWHYDMPSSLKGGLAMSSNGKYVLASQGGQYVYLFDNAFGAGNRPIRIFKDTKPRWVGMDQNGDKVGLGKYDLQVAAPTPGVLADQQSLPVYSEGDTLKLRIFATNPLSVQPVLKVKIALSLPQLNWWDAVAAQSDAKSQTPSTRSKAIEYLSEGLPGYSEIYDEVFAPGANSSLDQTLSLEVPSLLMPEWLSDLLSALEYVLPFDDLLGDWASPLNKLTGKESSDSVIGAANTKFVQSNSIFPLLGIGTVTLYDAQTGAVQDADSFYFIYGLTG